MTSIELEAVSKVYSLRHDRARSFQEMLVGAVRRRSDATEPFWALRGVSLSIEPGQTVGLIGANGSGKSSLLKLIARIIEPTSGRIRVNGQVAGLLEVGVGFHPDLTGRENIYLSGAVLGWSRRQIEGICDQIIDFAEIDRFIDTPIKHYSSGMLVRLGFAVATGVQPEILLVDEVLAVGDQHFQEKCLKRVADMQRRGVTVILVSHALDLVRRFCNRVIWLADGQVVSDGDPDTVTAAYLDLVRSANARPGSGQAGGIGSRWGTGEVQIGHVTLLNGAGRETRTYRTGERMIVRITYHAPARVEQPAFGVAIHRDDGVQVVGPNSVRTGADIPFVEGDGTVDYVLDWLPLNAGNYELTAAVYDRNVYQAYDHIHRAFPFSVIPSSASGDGLLVFQREHWAHYPAPVAGAGNLGQSAPAAAAVGREAQT